MKTKEIACGSGQNSVLRTPAAPGWLWLRARYEYSLLARVLRGLPRPGAGPVPEVS